MFTLLSAMSLGVKCTVGVAAIIRRKSRHRPRLLTRARADKASLAMYQPAVYCPLGKVGTDWGKSVSVHGLRQLCRAPVREMKIASFILRDFAAESRVRDALRDLF